MNTTTLDKKRLRARELDHRENDGIAVTLLWYEDANRVALRVVDNQTDEEFELEVPGSDALDAFRHPFAYILPAAA
jgi:hypothetical protein